MRVFQASGGAVTSLWEPNSPAEHRTKRLAVERGPTTVAARQERAASRSRNLTSWELTTEAIGSSHQRQQLPATGGTLRQRHVEAPTSCVAWYWHRWVVARSRYQSEPCPSAPVAEQRPERALVLGCVERGPTSGLERWVRILSAAGAADRRRNRKASRPSPSRRSFRRHNLPNHIPTRPSHHRIRTNTNRIRRSPSHSSSYAMTEPCVPSNQ